MAGDDAVYQAAILKAATYRLTSTSTEQLPNIIPSVCAQLATCKESLSLEKDAALKNDADLSTHIHRLRTRVSGLLQDRSPEARWAGTVLAKTAIECGGLAIVQDSLPWVRGLLSILNRYDPITTKQLAVIALTRIFLLTQGHQTLIREITTPSLPNLVASCCQLLSSAPRLVPTILNGFSKLISRHSTIFRSYVNQLRPILLQYMAPVSSEARFTEATMQSARTLFIQLHECAPKNTGASEWATGLKHAINCVHEDIDQLFRSVLEDWESTTGYHPIQHNVQALSAEPARLEKDTLGLGTWIGLQQGSRRIIGLLDLLRSYVATRTSFSADVAVGLLLDLITRLLSLARPVHPREWESTGRADSRFDRKERDELALFLPELHVSAIRMAGALLKRLGVSSPGVASALLQQVAWIFGAEKTEPALREAAYEALAESLSYVGPSLEKRCVASLSDVAVCCCNDLLSSSTAWASSTSQLTESKMNGVTVNLVNSSTRSRTAQTSSTVLAAASIFLPNLLKQLRTEFIPRRMRAEMDRVAVLTRHKAALIASVQNSSVDQASLLPLLARIFADDTDVQLLLKPRMPVILHSPEVSQPTDHEESNEVPEGGSGNMNVYQEEHEADQIRFASSQPNLDHLFPVEHAQNHVNGPWNGDLGVSGDRLLVPEAEPSTADAAKPNKRTLETDLPTDADKRPRIDGPRAATDDTDFDARNGGSGGQRTAESAAEISKHIRGLERTTDEGVGGSNWSDVPAIAGETMNLRTSAQQEQDDSDDDDFVMPQLHFRSASDDDEGD